MDLKQLGDLHTVAEAQFDRDAQELSDALARERELRAALDALAASQSRRTQALGGELEIAFAQTGEASWQTWATERRKDLLMYLAHQQAITAQIKARVQASFGRRAALADLLDKERIAHTAEYEKKQLQTLVDLEVRRRWMVAQARAQTS